MRALDLFSGIGGFALGFERAGIETAAFCEVDKFCREWLAYRWAGVPIYPDVRELHGGSIGPIDVVCGGFPCQDISAAGNGEGLDGARSGLWFEMLRIVREVRPLWVVIENVPALRTRGADIVLDGLERAGYTCWPFVVGADDIGASHRRKRVWIVARRLADADRNTLRIIQQRMSGGRADGVRDEGQALAGDNGAVGDAHREPVECGQPDAGRGSLGRTTADGAGAGGSQHVADADSSGCETGGELRARPGESDASGTGEAMANTDEPGQPGRRIEQPRGGEESRGVADTARGGCGTDGSASRSPGHSYERDALVANCYGDGFGGQRLEDRRELGGAHRDLADGRGGPRDGDRGHGRPEELGDTDRAGLEGHPGPAVVPERARLRPAAAAGFRWPAGPGQPQHEWEAPRTITNAECKLGVSVDGLPRRMGPTLNKARLKAAGNSVVPEIPEIIATVILKIERMLREAA